MSEATTIDTELAVTKFVERYREHQGKQVDNSSLPAGSSMYYYCRHCGVHTETLPEGHWGRPKTVCVPCDVIEKHGLMPEAIKRAKKEQGT